MIGGLVKLALLAAVVVLLGLAIFRPGTLFGVDSEAIAHSLGGEVDQSSAICADAPAGGWRCTLHGGLVEGVQYQVKSRRFGCWRGVKVVQPRSDKKAEAEVTGCVGFADLFAG